MSVRCDVDTASCLDRLGWRSCADTYRRRASRRAGAPVGANLILNAAWNWLFYGRRSPRAGLVGTLMLDLSNIELIQRTAQVDTARARALLPYAGWCAFATALNMAIAKRHYS
ncbi:TspO/MBR family protein [Streptomyces sp. NPDC056975]|uniref:TspO/MBR family protein n=1 Tax=Streptomyces sp. NPDC056975 TaxID=3345985 RepID=UPI003626FC85